MSERKAAPLIVHGWALYAHPLFLDQLQALTLEEDLHWVQLQLL